MNHPGVFSLVFMVTDSLCVVAAETPMLEGEEEEGLRLWHLVKSSEDPEIPKHRKSSMRERERAKAIPEIYLTRLLSMKVTHTKLQPVSLSTCFALSTCPSLYLSVSL